MRDAPAASNEGESIMRHLTLLAALLAGLALAGPTQPAKTPDYLAAAVADSSRPVADTDRDANRKPAETLEFAGVAPGLKVAELLPGGGYFTRIIARAVGPSGHVYAVVPAPSPNDPPNTPDFAARIKAVAADPRYSNVTVVSEPFAQLKTPESVDLVWTSQNYHDLHNLPGLDLGVFNQMVFEALKPGGIYFILDHATAPGAGVSETATLHRIDPEAVKREVEAAGFEFVGESNILRQPGDPHTAKIFDPSIRGQTDQFILKFRKPKKA
jgi:predicted methyltransferase